MHTQQEQWLGMNGVLVCDLTMRPGSSQGVSARIYRKDQTGNVCEINEFGENEASFNFLFRSGLHIKGTLKQESRKGKPELIDIIGQMTFEEASGHKTSFSGAMTTFHSGAAEHHVPAFKPLMPPKPAVHVPSPTPAAAAPAHRKALAAELFPYIYLRHWDAIDADATRCGFACAPVNFSANSFYTALLAMPALTLVQMKSLALQFISGKVAFDEEYVASVDQLQGLIQLFPKAAEMISEPDCVPATIIGALAELFGKTPAQMQGYLAGPDFTKTIAGVWQSYIALLITTDFNNALLGQFSQLLLTEHVLDYLFNPLLAPGRLDQGLLATLLNASLVLPEALFPLPSAESGTPVAPLANTIAPYAIGDLQMVRQRFLRHELGELAHIENIMAHECREIFRKRTQAQMSTEQHHSISAESVENQANDTRNNLLKHSEHAVAEKALTNKYTDFKTSYGPPTEATMNGSWTEWTSQGKKPGVDDVTEFARDILNQTVTRITRDVSQARSRSAFEQAEESVKSVIDNSAGQGKLIVAMRWVNTVHEASVLNYGKRLMVEFLLPQPARNFVEKRLGRDCGAIAMPLPLARQGVTSFASISRDNYADLAAACEVTDLTPPPARSRSVSISLRGGEETLVPVPPGYCVSDARVNILSGANGADAPVILIGSEKFKTGDDPAKVRQFGEEQSIAVSVPVQAPAPAPAPAPVPAGPPPDAAGLVAPSGPTAPGELLFNVVIVCQPSDTTFDEWRIKTYQAIFNGYKKQASLFSSENETSFGRGRSVRSPQAARRIEQTQLKQGCIRLLLENAFGKGADQGTHGERALPDAYALQFLHEAFEWDEMSTRFYASGNGAGQDTPLSDLGEQDDARFAAFLEADVARIMVPAHPAQVLPLLFFLATGQRWALPSMLTPVMADQLALVHALKQATMQDGTPVGKSWEVVLPTSMQIIDDSFHVHSAPQQEMNS